MRPGLSTDLAAAVEFQSTHPRGVRQVSGITDYNLLEFQSTHPRGVRLSAFALKRSFVKISIHAPTWGATKVNTDVNVMHLFQSTHPRGVRRGRLMSFFLPLLFQSTHPRGVRHGEDVVMERIDRISIHAPTWGAT